MCRTSVVELGHKCCPTREAQSHDNTVRPAGHGVPVTLLALLLIPLLPCELHLSVTVMSYGTNTAPLVSHVLSSQQLNTLERSVLLRLAMSPQPSSQRCAGFIFRFPLLTCSLCAERRFSHRLCVSVHQFACIKVLLGLLAIPHTINKQ